MADFLGTFDMLHLALLIDHVSKNEATVFILSKRKVYISIILDLFAWEPQEKAEAKRQIE